MDHKKDDNHLKRPLYGALQAQRKEVALTKPTAVFDLPADLLASLQQDHASSTTVATAAESDPASHDEQTNVDENAGTAALASSSSLRSQTCSTCNTSSSFATVAEHRRHVKSDWHRYNLKQKLRSQRPVDESTFDRLIGELDESISGSDSDGSTSSANDDSGSGGHQQQGDDRILSQLLRKQARLDAGTGTDAAAADGSEDAAAAPARKGSPYVWFASPLLPAEHRLGIYRALFSPEDLQASNLAQRLAARQLQPKDARTLAKQKAAIQQQQADSPQSIGPAIAAATATAASEPHIFLCMIGGGHFAGMIVSLAPKMERKASGANERAAIVLVHKTFHRYTTRRKQGGAQSANDAAKGAAHSAGAAIRRANEAALEAEVRSLLDEWAPLLKSCELLFVRANGIGNRRALFGPYEKQVLTTRDPRIRSFPFTTRRATQSELMRAFVELTRARVVEAVREATAKSDVVDGPKAKTASAQKSTPPTKPSKEEEESLLHTSQLQALIRRSKAPAMLKYLSSNNLSPDFRFFPPSNAANRHASTPLHLAASSSSPIMVSALLTKASADPTALNGDDKVPFAIAGDRATRDAFRIARSELGDSRWDWDKAQCPPALSRDEAEAREKAQQTEATQQEQQRRKAELERIEKERASANGAKASAGKKVSVLETTAADRREQEARGMTAEQKQRLERERRARAAEERIRNMTGGQS